MVPYPQTPEKYREIADWHRKVAQEALTVEAKAKLLEIAKAYDELARIATKEHAHSAPSSGPASALISRLKNWRR
jgi:hypothetical protein